MGHPAIHIAASHTNGPYATARTTSGERSQRRPRRSWLRAACCLSILCGINWCTLGMMSAQAQEPSSTELAMGALFSPYRAPAERQMGLVQRSFLDLLEDSQRKLQIALVIDGTDSMTDEMDGLRKSLMRMIQDLQRYRGARVEFQLVVYRDAGAASGEVAFPLNLAGNTFTGEIDKVMQVAQTLGVESGAPYFPELIDLGIYEAIDKLGWATDEQTSRWLIVFGDAPPYAAGFNEPETKASRRYETDVLVSLAKRKGIRVNCVLCTSRDTERESFTTSLPQTREFMNTLATKTDGLMLDMSYPNVEQALQEAMRKPEPEYVAVGRITEEEIKKMRETLKTAIATTPQKPGRVRIAILPHASFVDDLDRDGPGMLLAYELQHKLSNMAGLELALIDEVAQQVESLQSEDVRKDEQVLLRVAQELPADYVLWGIYQERGNRVEARSRLYQRTAKGMVELSPDAMTSVNLGEETELAGRHLKKLIEQALQPRNSTAPQDPLLAHFAAFNARPSDQTQATFIPVADTAQKRTQLLTAFGKLEESLSYVAGDPQAAPLLTEAERVLLEALQGEDEKEDCWGYWLLANCYWNQINLQTDPAERAKMTTAFLDALSKAYLYRDAPQCSPSERLEIEAGFHLLVHDEKDLVRAVELYQQLAMSGPTVNWSPARRATWMLAGIYAGDFGVKDDPKGKEVMDAVKAKQELVKILALWEDSPEGNFIKQNMRWDPASGVTQHPALPTLKPDFSASGERSDSQGSL